MPVRHHTRFTARPTGDPPVRAGGAGHLPDALRRPYRVIAFDWDGTAVTDRSADASLVADLLSHLLDCGVVVAVISGTSFANVDGQLSRDRTSYRRPGLYVLANRGSEVYTYDSTGAPQLVFRRAATPVEDSALSATTAAVVGELSNRFGLVTRVVANRLNRRKIDLIPFAEWADPPKSRIAELEVATSVRLREHGIPNGIGEVAALAGRHGRALGLADARLTSDAKYLEIGLTDKGDSLDWVVRNLIRAAGLSASDLLVIGDEFGPVAGLPGSDSLMMVPASAGATFVSVGAEPRGVPHGVIRRPGGPSAFVEVLGEQIRLRSAGTPNVGRS